jgi:hypothetical protein
VVADNDATHKHPTIKAWLARNSRVKDLIAAIETLIDGWS